MSSNNQVTLVKNKNGDLIDPNTDKVDYAETELDEIKSGLMKTAENTEEAIGNLTNLAQASQNPMHYDSLSKLISAHAKTSREAINTVRTKLDIYKEMNKGEQPAADNPEKHTHYHLHNSTSTELLNQALGDDEGDE